MATTELKKFIVIPLKTVKRLQIYSSTRNDLTHDYPKLISCIVIRVNSKVSNNISISQMFFLINAMFVMFFNDRVLFCILEILTILFKKWFILQTIVIIMTTLMLFNYIFMFYSSMTHFVNS